MIGILVAAHGDVGPAFCRAAAGIVGPMEKVEARALAYGEAPADARTRIAEALARLDDGDGVLVLTDMLGGTPTNVSLLFLQAGRVEVLSGMNLPMLIKAQGVRAEMGLSELARFLRDYGSRNIVLASEIWAGGPPEG
jgi:PTS system mannose-specific IIA component